MISLLRSVVALISADLGPSPISFRTLTEIKYTLFATRLFIGTWYGPIPIGAYICVVSWVDPCSL